MLCAICSSALGLTHNAGTEVALQAKSHRYVVLMHLTDWDCRVQD